MDKTKFIIADTFNPFIDEFMGCCEKAGAPVVLCTTAQEIKQEISKTPLNIMILLSVSDELQDFSNIVYELEKESLIGCTIFLINSQDKDTISFLDSHHGQWMDCASVYGRDIFDNLMQIHDEIVNQDINMDLPADDQYQAPAVPATGDRDAYTVVIASPKGGTGKSTLAMEIAYFLTDVKERRVCLIDLNTSFDTLSTTIACVRKDRDHLTLYDWVLNIQDQCYDKMTREERIELEKSPDKDFTPYLEKYGFTFSKEDVQQLLIKDPKTGAKGKRDSGLWILPAIALPVDMKYVRESYVEKILGVLKSWFDIIIVDTADNLSYVTTEGYRGGDVTYLVTSHSTAATVVAAKLMSNLKEFGLDNHDYRLIVNSPNGAFYEKDPRTFARALDVELSASLPFEIGIQKSHAKGRPFCIYNRRSKFAKALEAVVAEIEDDALYKKQGGNY